MVRYRVIAVNITAMGILIHIGTPLTVNLFIQIGMFLYYHVYLLYFNNVKD